MYDGWKSYRYFLDLNRCLAHPLKEAEIVALRTKGRSKAEAEYLISPLRAIFHKTKSGRKEHPLTNMSLHYRMLSTLTTLHSKGHMDADVLKLVSKLSDTSMDLFTFTLR
jgi:hypothetical protein